MPYPSSARHTLATVLPLHRFQRDLPLLRVRLRRRIRLPFRHSRRRTVPHAERLLPVPGTERHDVG